MKTAKEYVEKMRSDKEFVEQLRKQLKAEQEAGEKEIYTAISKAAKELGYDVSPKQVQEICKQNEDVSEEELGKIAGGTSCSPFISAITVGVASLTVSTVTAITVSVNSEDLPD